MDTVSKEIRSRMMAANRRRDTKPKMILLISDIHQRDEPPNLIGSGKAPRLMSR